MAYVAPHVYTPGEIVTHDNLNSLGTAITQCLHWNDYAQITSNSAGITATTEGTSVAFITGANLNYTGSRQMIWFDIPAYTLTSGVLLTIVPYRDTTPLGRLQVSATSSSTNPGIMGSILDTPSAAAHTYAIKAYVASGTFTALAGAGGTGALVPAWMAVIEFPA